MSLKRSAESSRQAQAARFNRHVDAQFLSQSSGAVCGAQKRVLTQAKVELRKIFEKQNDG